MNNNQTNKIKNKYGLKSENLNYNSQIFTLTSLFLHSSTQPHQASTPPPTITAAATVLFLKLDPESRLLLLLLLLRSLIIVTHDKLRNFSPLSSSYFCLSCLCYIALPSALAVCPLPSLPSVFFFKDYGDYVC